MTFWQLILVLIPTVVIFILLRYAETSQKYDELSKLLYFWNKRLKLLDYISDKLEKTKRDPLNDIDPLDAVFRNIGDDRNLDRIIDAISHGEKILKKK